MAGVSVFTQTAATQQAQAAPGVTPLEQLREAVRQRLRTQFPGAELADLNDQKRQQAQTVIEALVNDWLPRAASAGQPFTQPPAVLVTQLMNDLFGWGPLEPYLRLPTVEEIMINGPEQVWIDDAEQGMYRAAVRFTDMNAVFQLVNQAAGAQARELSRRQPRLNCQMADGSRLNAVMLPLLGNVPIAVTIRKHRLVATTPADLVRLGTLSQASADFLVAAMQARLNIIVAGGTGSGKTNTLNALLSILPLEERLITVEDTAELQLNPPGVAPGAPAARNWISLVTAEPNDEDKSAGVTLDDLVINALRMRPDRIVTGEARGGEIRSVLMAANTGHDGQLLTLHANSVREVASRVVQMWQIADSKMAPSVILRYLADAFDVIVYIERVTVGGQRRRCVREIAELLPSRDMEPGADTIGINTLFAEQGVGLQPVNRVIHLNRLAQLRGERSLDFNRILGWPAGA